MFRRALPSEKNLSMVNLHYCVTPGSSLTPTLKSPKETQYIFQGSNATGFAAAKASTAFGNLMSFEEVSQWHMPIL